MSNPPPVSTASAYRLRAARRGDAEAIRALISELGYLEAADAQTVAWVISHPEMEIFIAADSMDKAVGVLTLSHRPQLRMKGRIATIDELVVLKAWQRKGVGKALIARALERAKVLGAKRIELTTHKGRGEVVRQFYIACGFAEADSAVMRLDIADPNRR